MEDQLVLDSQDDNEFAYLVIKRALDITIAIIAIIFLSPVFLVIPILIKLDSKGPVIFKQVRIGKNNKPFYIYKFRSMKNDTPNVATNELEEGQSYVTELGQFLRKTSIDELPQLINVIKGEMSIIGPRPVIESETELIKLREDYKINTMLPGITGFAQVNGRDFVSIEDKVKYDYQYLANKSIVMDVKILLKTFILVIKEEDIKIL